MAGSRSHLIKDGVSTQNQGLPPLQPMPSRHPVACTAPSTQTCRELLDAASALSHQSQWGLSIGESPGKMCTGTQLLNHPLRSSECQAPISAKAPGVSGLHQPLSLGPWHIHMFSPGTFSLPPSGPPSSALNLRTIKSSESNKPVTKGKIQCDSNYTRYLSTQIHRVRKQNGGF